MAKMTCDYVGDDLINLKTDFGGKKRFISLDFDDDWNKKYVQVWFEDKNKYARLVMNIPCYRNSQLSLVHYTATHVCVRIANRVYKRHVNISFFNKNNKLSNMLHVDAGETRYKSLK